MVKLGFRTGSNPWTKQFYSKKAEIWLTSWSVSASIWFQSNFHGEICFFIIFSIIIINILEVGHFIIIINLILKQSMTIKWDVDIGVYRSGQCGWAAVGDVGAGLLAEIDEALEAASRILVGTKLRNVAELASTSNKVGWCLPRPNCVHKSIEIALWKGTGGARWNKTVSRGNQYCQAEVMAEVLRYIAFIGQQNIHQCFAYFEHQEERN